MNKSTHKGLKARYLAAALAAMLAVAMLPGNMKGVEAAPSGGTTTCSCTSFRASSSDSSMCVCGHALSDHASGSGACSATVISGGSGGGSSSSGSTTSSTSSTPNISEEELAKAYEEALRAANEEKIAQAEKAQAAKEEQIRKEEAARIALEEAQQAKFEEASRENSTITAGGQVLNTTVDGAYTAKGVDGTAVVTPIEEVQRALKLAEGEKPRVTTWDVTKENSPQAAKLLEDLAKYARGELGPMFQVNVNKMSNGQYTTMTLLDGSVDMTVGVPAGYRQEGAEFVVGHVMRGGVREILTDRDNNPNTVTFKARAGEGAYALIKVEKNHPVPVPESNNGSLVTEGLLSQLAALADANLSDEDKELLEQYGKADEESNKLTPDQFESDEAWERAIDAVYQKYGFESYDDANDKAGSVMERLAE